MNRITGTINIKIIIGVLIALAVVVAVAAVVSLDVLGSKGGGLGKEFKYEVDELTRIDPNLIIYEESAKPIKTGFADTHGIAVDPKGSVYVAGDKAVRSFARSGDQLSEIKLGDAPRCLTVAKDSTIYIGMKDHVEIYDTQGQRQANWDSLGKDAILTSIVASEENVFVADAGNRIVIRYDLEGGIINEIGKRDTFRNIPGFVIPSPYFDLALPRDGLLRVVNPGRLRIEAYTLDGDIEFWWGSPSPAIEGFCGCCNPVNIAILPDGGFVTCEKGLVRIKIYNSGGSFVGVVAGPEQFGAGGTTKICMLPEECQTSGFDVAVDSEGRVFVLDTVDNIVKVFSKVKDL
ncbi:MAG: NHL repeat-containing protein [Planctomycetota bacterium]|jgi:sugar lactone lactonase YvrE